MSTPNPTPKPGPTQVSSRAKLRACLAANVPFDLEVIRYRLQGISSRLKVAEFTKPYGPEAANKLDDLADELEAAQRALQPAPAA